MKRLKKIQLTQKRLSILGLLIVMIWAGLYANRFRVEGIERRVISYFYPAIPQMSTIATAKDNVPYCGNKDPKQRLDVYTPRSSGSATLPMVLYIHGGGWRSGDKQNSVVYNYGPAVINSGYSFISMDYDLAPKAHFPVQPQEVSCALNFLSSNATKYHIDPDHTILMGDSAGGQLAAYTALRPTKAVTVRGVIDLYGDADLMAQMDRRVHPNPNVRGYLGVKNDQLAEQASPLTYVHRGAPPFLIIHGENDHTVPIEQSERLADALEAVGTSAQLIKVQHAGHAFGLRSGGHPTIQQLDLNIEDFLTPLKQ